MRAKQWTLRKRRKSAESIRSRCILKYSSTKHSNLRSALSFHRPRSCPPHHLVSHPYRLPARVPARPKWAVESHIQSAHAYARKREWVPARTHPPKRRARARAHARARTHAHAYGRSSPGSSTSRRSPPRPSSPPEPPPPPPPVSQPPSTQVAASNPSRRLGINPARGRMQRRARPHTRPGRNGAARCAPAQLRTEGRPRNRPHRSTGRPRRSKSRRWHSQGRP